MKTTKTPVHYTHQYILSPMHPVTVNVIGCGGTGSQVISSLARMDRALRALHHPGLFVTAIDPDRVTDANMGRQLFSPSELGDYKAAALVSRINRFFGLTWESVPELFSSAVKAANITISCVDTGPARKEISGILAASAKDNKTTRHYHEALYWMDFGNMATRGQCVIGTLVSIEQPKKSEYACRTTMPTIGKIHPEIFKKDKNGDQGPSCSLAGALLNQDLFINSNLANMGLAILWKMFKDYVITDHGCYVNLDTMTMNPIRIK